VARGAVAGSLVVNTDTEFRALAQAQAAADISDFAAALERFRSTARLPDKDTQVSYVDMQKISGGRMSKSAAQRLSKLSTVPSPTAKTGAHVEEYVRACGATEEHVQVWLAEYRRVRRGEPPAAGDHAMRVTPGPARNRGHTTGFLAWLTDTDAFPAPRLGLDGRKLILFLSAAIVDDTGSAETTYRSLLRRWGTARDHWAFGMTLDHLEVYLSQYVGWSARKVPLWSKIRDLLDAAIRDPGARESVLADAAGLYQQVTGKPPPEYEGTIHLPWWGYPRTGRTQLDTVLTSLPQAGRTDRHRTRAHRTPGGQVPPAPSPRHHPPRVPRTASPRDRRPPPRTATRLAGNGLAEREKRLVAAAKRLVADGPKPVFELPHTVADLPGPAMWATSQAFG
jgi:hypothetical protein